MRYGFRYEAEALDGAAGLARQTNDEGAAHDNCQAAREDRMRSDFQRFHAHGLAEPWQLADSNFSDSFRGNIPQGNPCSTRGEYELAASLDLLMDGHLNCLLIVRHDRFICDAPTTLLSGLLERGTAEVLVDAFGRTVGNGDDAGENAHARLLWGQQIHTIHDFDLEMSRMSFMHMVLSTALHMS